MSLRFPFPPASRLKSPATFRHIYQHGQRAGDEHLLMFALQNHGPETRIGLSVSKKHGSAPARNRKKRLLREAFRLLRNELPSGLDLILVPRQRPDSSLADFQRSVTYLAERLQRKIARSVSSDAAESRLRRHAQAAQQAATDADGAADD